MYRVLLDTNVLLDCVDPRRKFHKDAMLLMKQCNGGGDMAIASSLSFKDVYFVMDKLYNEPTAREATRLLADLVGIGPISAEETLMALESNEPDFKDVLVRACAELNDIDFIISRDKEAFGKSTVRKLTAHEFLQLVN